MIKFRLKELLAEKQRIEGQSITISDISDATGISKKVLYNISSPSRVVVTNTAFVESLCRYFSCNVEDFITFAPPLDEDSTCNVDELYPGRKQ